MAGEDRVLAGGAKHIDFQTDPSRYRHWKLDVAGEVATLTMDVDENGGLFEGYQLKGPGQIETMDLDVGVFKQNTGDYVLRGWIDIDSFAGGASAPAADGAGSRMFQQKLAPAAAGQHG